VARYVFGILIASASLRKLIQLSDVYGNKQRHGRGGLQKDPKSYPVFCEHAEISTASDTDHRRLRRIQSHAFSTKALEAQKSVLQCYTKKFIARLHMEARLKNGIVDMTAWINCLTVDIIGELAFSTPFGSLEAGELDPRVQMLFTSIKKFTFVKEVLRLPSFLAAALIAGYSAVFMRGGAAIGGIGADVMMKRRTRFELERPDFVSHMLRKTDAKDAECVPLRSRPGQRC